MVKIYRTPQSKILATPMRTTANQSFAIPPAIPVFTTIRKTKYCLRLSPNEMFDQLAVGCYYAKVDNINIIL